MQPAARIDHLLLALLIATLSGTAWTATGCNNSETGHLPIPEGFAAAVPGETGESEIIKELGQPVRRIEQGEWTNLLYEGYSASTITWYNLVATKAGVVQFVSVEIPVKDRYLLSEVTRQYGEPQEITTSSRSRNARTHIYADQGLAFVSRSEQGQELVVSIARYVPMTLDQYLDTYGSDY